MRMRRKMTDREEPVSEEIHSGKRQNREMAVVTYIVMVLFFVMAGYLVYFILHDSDSVLNNSYNKRQELLAKRIKKGAYCQIMVKYWQKQ